MVDTATEPDARVYFAAERTQLAWIRSGVALMGLGFVVARFGLVLRELSSADTTGPHHTASLWVGVVLVFFGVALHLNAAVQHAMTIRRLRRGETLQFKTVSLATILTGLLALLGIVVGAYLAVQI